MRVDEVPGAADGELEQPVAISVTLTSRASTRERVAAVAVTVTLQGFAGESIEEALGAPSWRPQKIGCGKGTPGR